MKLTAKHLTIVTAALMLFLVADLQAAVAQQQAEPSGVGQMASGLNPMNWSMPQWQMPNLRNLLPGNDEKERIIQKKDGLFDEVTKTASSSWTRTKQALNPQKLNPINFFPASARTPAAEKPAETKPGFFRSLFSPAVPQEKENTTVTDFLRQSRPSP